MKPALYALLISFLCILPFQSVSAKNPPCLKKALHFLKKHDPAGYQIYKRANSGKFSKWINCSVKNYSLHTAVHEWVHILNYRGFRKYRFYMPGDFWTSVPEKRFFPRSRISTFKDPRMRDIYYINYVKDIKGDFLNLLDELNAYTHGLESARKLGAVRPYGKGMDARDGLAAMMFILEEYLRHGRLKEKKQYALILKEAKYAALVMTLWRNAEQVLITSSARKDLGTHDRYKLQAVYGLGHYQEMRRLPGWTEDREKARKKIIRLYRLKEKQPSD